MLPGRAARYGPVTPVISFRAPGEPLPADSISRWFWPGADRFRGRDDPYRRRPPRKSGTEISRRYSRQTVRRALGRVERGRRVRAGTVHPVQPVILNRGVKVRT